MGLLKPHRPSDYPSIWLYILDETHITVTLTTAVILAYTRNPHVAWFTIGALSASQMAKGIKLLLRRPRPPPPPPSDSRPSPVRPKKTYGMPSTHSTALTFYMAYILPLLPTIIASASASSTGTTWSDIASSPLSLPATSLALIGSWGAGLWSRRELGYHTTPQIVVGAILGAGMAGAWRWVWEAGKRGGWGVEEGLRALMEGTWELTGKRVFG